MGAIYYEGRTGKVYENGVEVGCHFVDNWEHIREQDTKHKAAYFSIDNSGFKEKDIVTVQVDVYNGCIRWRVNARLVA